MLVENNWEIHGQVCAASVHLGWDGNWNSRRIWAVTLTFLKQSSDKSFSRAVVTFEVAPHQERICPHGMKVVIYNGFTAYYWAGSQWHLSKYRRRRWTWCNSTRTSGCISTTGWTGLIKHIVQEVAGYCSFKTHHFYQWWPALCSLQKENRISKLQAK